MPYTVVDLDGGIRVAANDVGPPTGFPIVVHHGLIASIRDAALFAGLVDAGRRVLLLARPGYGDSAPVVLPDVAGWGALAEAALDALHVDAFDILGISSGAPYAYALAARCPARTRSVFIFSGTPALYDARVAALWPYPLDTAASLAELQALARSLFFAGLSPAQAQEPAIVDASAHDCFGIALDLRIRLRAWGFDLRDIGARVFMQHALDDSSVPFATAQITASMLRHCRFDARETGDHFSGELLDAFLRRTVLGAGDRSVDAQHAPPLNQKSIPGG